LYDIQSNFTATDKKYLEYQQEKVYAETEYDNYRQQANVDIEALVEEVKDKEIELARLRTKIADRSNAFSQDETEQDRLKKQLDSLTHKLNE